MTSYSVRIEVSYGKKHTPGHDALTPWQGMKRSKSHEYTFFASRAIALREC